MRTIGHLVFAATLAMSQVVAAQPAQPVVDMTSIEVDSVGGPGKRPGNPPTPVGTGGVMTPQGNRFAVRCAGGHYPLESSPHAASNLTLFRRIKVRSVADN